MRSTSLESFPVLSRLYIIMYNRTKEIEMRTMLKNFVGLIILVFISHAAAAETLDVTSGQLSAETLSINVPTRWMTQEEVETRFGTPISKSSPVGDPPISYWEYDQFIVYFEYDKVLDTVRNVSTR